MLRRLAIIIWATASLAACDRLPGRSAEPAASPRGMPDFGGVEVVEVTADGVGPTRNAAILDALNLVVRKTTGTPIEGLSVNLNGSFVINGQAGDAGLTLDAVAAMTRGAVRSFEIVEEREKREPAWRSMFGREEVKREPSSWRVTVKAKVAKFKDTAASSLPKVVIARPRTAVDDYEVGDQTLAARDAAEAVRAAVAEAVSKSSRFFVINRDFDEALDAEAGNITSANANPLELAKLGQRLSADILILPEIRSLTYRKSSRTLRLSGRELRSYAGGADVAFNVLNVATGQLILSEHYTIEFPATPPTVMGSQAVDERAVQAMLAEMAETFTRAIVRKTFPVSIIAMTGPVATLSQGAAGLNVGEVYQVVQLGAELKDPQTSQSLGKTETVVGEVTVTRTSEKTSEGTYRGAWDSRQFKPGLLELRAVPLSAPAPVAPPPPNKAAEAPSLVAGPSLAVTPPPRAVTRPPPKKKDEFDEGYKF